MFDYHEVGVYLPTNYSCCGIPALSSGDLEGFEKMVMHNVDVLKEGSFDLIVTPCSSCTETIRSLWPKMAGKMPYKYRDAINELSQKAMDINAFLVDVLKAVSYTHLDVYKRQAKNITEYGVFVDLGGLDGLLHITDMSWKRIRHPREMVTLGQDLELKVLSFDKDNQKVSLGLKQLVPDPWQDITARFPEASRHNGKVTNLVDYGAFVELEPGVEGLVHISEMSWTRKLRHPSQMVRQGDEVEVVILGVDPEKKRISLGMKQIKPNPWELVGEKYPEGTILSLIHIFALSHKTDKITTDAAEAVDSDASHWGTPSIREKVCGTILMRPTPGPARPHKERRNAV